MCTEVQRTYDDMVEAVKRKVQEDLVEKWKKKDTYFHIESARLAVSSGDEFVTTVFGCAEFTQKELSSFR